jgi:ADP-ribose pyrophosphatase YjhB (NUDIX family)
VIELIPAPLHRALLRMADRVRRAWRRRVGFAGLGVRILALDEADRVLLVRHSYGTGDWMPPSGGISAGEDACRAAARELREETTAQLLGAVELIGQPGVPDRARLIAGRLRGRPRADNREIVAVGMFALDTLPRPMTAAMAGNLPRWVRTAAAALPAPG